MSSGYLRQTQTHTHTHTHIHTHTHTHTGAAWSEMKSAMSSALGEEASKQIYALRYVDPTQEGKTRYKSIRSLLTLYQVSFEPNKVYRRVNPGICLSKPSSIYLSKPIPKFRPKGAKY